MSNYVCCMSGDNTLGDITLILDSRLFGFLPKTKWIDLQCLIALVELRQESWCHHMLWGSQKQPCRRRARAVCVSLFDKLDGRAVSAHIRVQKAMWPYFSLKFDSGGILQVFRAKSRWNIMYLGDYWVLTKPFHCLNRCHGDHNNRQRKSWLKRDENVYPARDI